MDEKKIERINEFLAYRNTVTEMLPERTVRELIKTDDAIQTRIAQINSAKEVIRQNSINISNIASDTGMSNKTFYYNELLGAYVEYYKEKMNNSFSNGKDEIKRLKEKIDELSVMIDKFKLRDIETEKLRVTLSIVQKELMLANSEKEKLMRKCEQLLNKNESKNSGRAVKILLPKDGDMGSYFSNN